MRIYLDGLAKDHVVTKRMLPHWQALGAEIVHDIQDAQIHLAYVEFTKTSKIPKILRIDGIYYDDGRVFLNKPIRRSCEIADGLIFQSEYSKRAAAHFLTYPLKPDQVIYNGGDPTWAEPKDHQNFNIVVASNWRRWKRLPEMVVAITKMIHEYPDIHLHVVGKTPPMPQGTFLHFYGDLRHDEMRELYRKMDVAIHIAKREWCPNAVLEFLAAGIPTLVSDQGHGSTELLEMIDRSLIVMDDYDPDPYLPVKQYSEKWNELSEDFESNLQSKIQIVMKYGPKRVQLPDELTVPYMANRYFKFMEQFI